MNRLPQFLRWLTFAALADWLLTRSLTRAAIYMPKSPPVIALYQGIGLAGHVGLTLAGLLALGALAWIAWYEWQRRRAVGLPLLLVGRAACSLFFLVSPPGGWLAVGSHLIDLATVVMIVGQGRATRRHGGAALLLVALALVAGTLYQLGPAWYAALQQPGPPALAGAFYNAGELFVVLGAIAMWHTHARGAARPVWLAAAVPVLAFVLLYLFNPALTGILAIWSMGLSLYLPWPAYAAALWLAGVTAIVALRRGQPAGWALLLLAAGGYAPQLSTHVFLGLIALWLLAKEPLTVHELGHGRQDPVAALA